MRKMNIFQVVKKSPKKKAAKKVGAKKTAKASPKKVRFSLLRYFGNLY